ncbi:MAG: hypothetical protein U9N81_03220 [Bacillota bacterium]|nr:hypothetical protein [Bacillota bacterium]
MSFNLVLDEPADHDKVEDHEGLTFFAKDDLLEMCKGFTVALSSYGLEIKPDVESADSGCGSCSSC